MPFCPKCGFVIDPNDRYWSLETDLPPPNNKRYWGGEVNLWNHWSDQPGEPEGEPHDCGARAKSHTYAKRGWNAVTAYHLHPWQWSP